MHTPAAAFRRTQAERDDQNLSWQRSEQAFFAAGACHILAWAFLADHPNPGFGIVALRKVGEEWPSHVIASDGVWAFDHDGWTREAELLAVTAEFEPDRPWERLVIEDDLADFCRAHRHRPPEMFAGDPWPRARAYIARFPSNPRS